jgi:cell division protein FtsX
MPGNPLTDPNWAADVADTIERVVGSVRARTTTPLVHGARGVVFGLLAGIVAVVAVVLLVIVLTRGLQTLLDLAFDHATSVYASYLILGGIISLAGVFVLSKRSTND